MQLAKLALTDVTYLKWILLAALKQHTGSSAVPPLNYYLREAKKNREIWRSEQNVHIWSDFTLETPPTRKKVICNALDFRF